MHIEAPDLDLLRTFGAVHAARSVSRAAEALGVSQPTVSHALRRLRLRYRDPLFVRTRSGMSPTAAADRLAEAVRHALSIVETAHQQVDRFDPSTSERTFRLHMSDIGETVFVPALIRSLVRDAPGVRLETHQLDVPQILPALESGQIDLALGYIPDLAGTRHRSLFAERYVVVMRGGHPFAARRPTRKVLSELSYIVIRSHPITARAIDALGMGSQVKLTMPHFMVLPRILASTDLAVLMPIRLAEVFVEMGDYAVWRPRVGLPRFEVSVHWTWRFDGEPGNRWLRERIVELFGR